MKAIGFLVFIILVFYALAAAVKFLGHTWRESKEANTPHERYGMKLFVLVSLLCAILLLIVLFCDATGYTQVIANANRKSSVERGLPTGGKRLTPQEVKKKRLAKYGIK